MSVDQSFASGIWVVGRSDGAPALERLLRWGARDVAEAKYCSSRFAELDGAARIDVLVLRTAVERVLLEFELLKQESLARQRPGAGGAAQLR
ncbi:MAG: hypothetical protein QM756_04005 [Polyangiaceae bacterium]